MDLNELVSKLSPDNIDRLKLIIETGRWPDGRRMQQEEQAECLQALLLWEQQQDITNNQRTGFIAQSCRKQSKN